MAEEKTYVFGNDAASAGYGWNSGLFGGNGLAGGALGFVLGLLLGNGWGGFGGFGGGSSAAAASLGAQATANNNTDLIMSAISGTDADVRQLATTSGYSLDAIKSALATVGTSLATLGGQLGMSSLEVVNAIQSGNAAMSRQLCECCCENRLLTTTQGYESRIATIEQTNTLGSQADRNTRSITDAIAAQTVAMNDGFCAIKERELQSKIDSLTAVNTSLKGQIDNAAQTAQIAAMLAPIQAEVASIKASQPNTVPVQWPNLTAVNTTPFYGAGFNPYGYGFSGNSYWG